MNQLIQVKKKSHLEMMNELRLKNVDGGIIDENNERENSRV